MAQQGRTERAAWEGEMFRLLAENVKDYAIFVVDPHRHILSWSKGAEQLLGFSEQEIIGRRCDCFFTPEDVERGVPQRELEQALATGRGEDDRWHMRKDGSRFWASGAVTPLKDEAGRLRGFAKIMRDRTELKLAEEAARDRERLLQLLTDHAPVLIAHCDADRRYKFVNKPYAARFGLHPREVVGRRIRDLLGGPAYASVERHVDAALAGERVEFEVELALNGQGPQVLRCAYDPEFDGGGKVEGFVAAIVDVTESRRAEAALAASRRRLQALFDNTLDAVLLADDQARYVDANPAACKLLGYDREELLRLGVFDITPLPNGEAGRSAWAAFVRDGHQAGEYTLTRRDGSTAVVEYRAVANVQPGLHLSVLRDVTDRNRAEEALRESERRFRTLATNAPVGIFQTDPDGNCLFVNDRWCDITGLTPEDAAGEGWVRALHPDDRERVREDWYAAAATGREFAAEYRFRSPRGRTAWVQGKAVALRDGAGATTGYLGTVVDTTEQRRAAEALRESEGRLRAIIDNWPSVVFVKDRGGRYLLANRACEAYSGEPVERMAGKTDYDYLPADVADRFRADDRRVLQTGEVLRYEESAPLGGELRTSLTVKFPLRDAAGQPYAVCGIATDITDLRRAGEALRQSEGRLRTLSDNLPNGAIYQVVAGPRGGRRFLYISAGVERLFGVTPAEAMADATALYGLIPEEDRARVAAAEEASLRDRTPFDCEFRSRTRTGDVRWFHCRSAPRRLPTGEVIWEGVIIDVTEWRRAERESRASRERLDLVVNSVDVGLWYCDLPFDKLIWNAKVKEHFGLPPEADVTIDTFYERLHPDDRGRTREAIERSIRDHSGYDIEYRTVGPDGRERWVRAIGRTFYGPSGEPVSFDGITLDVTERVRQEQALKDADRRKDEFLATLAHELRNPLAPLRNGLQVMKLAAGNPEAVEQARGMMERQLAQMVRLIDDLLDVSRITRGKLTLRTERVDLTTAVQAAVEASRPLVEANGHRLTVALPPEPVYLLADPTRLAQVFSNLLTNAAKYSDRGGHVRLTAGREGGEVVVSVRDTGIGIAPEHLPRLFEMFSQVDTALERSQGGLGIGLALARGLTEMHGGGIEARSEGLGKGSEFVVRLPVAGGSTASAARQPGGEEAVVKPRRRILVADDNRDAADSLAMMLRLGGHEVHAVHDGQQAVDAAAWFRPDLALLDIGMPKLNGLQAARLIREQPWGRQVVLAAITGWGQDEDKRKATGAGFDRHLTKPVDPAALDELLASLPGGPG